MTQAAIEAENMAFRLKYASATDEPFELWHTSATIKLAAVVEDQPA